MSLCLPFGKRGIFNPVSIPGIIHTCMYYEHSWNYCTCTNVHVHVYTSYIYVAGIFLGRKLSQIGGKLRFCGENFRGLLAHCPPRFQTIVEKNFR